MFIPPTQCDFTVTAKLSNYSTVAHQAGGDVPLQAGEIVEHPRHFPPLQAALAADVIGNIKGLVKPEARFAIEVPNGIISFRGNVTEDAIVFDIPPLEQVSGQVKCSLEITAGDRYFAPWTQTISVEAAVRVAASVKSKGQPSRIKVGLKKIRP